MAIENPDQFNRTAGAAGANNVGVVDQLPDFVVALRYRDSWGAINASTVIRQLNFDNGVVQDETMAYGAHIGANVGVFGNDRISAAVNWGDGIGRYMTGAGQGGTINDTGNPGTFTGTNLIDYETQFAWGAWGGFTHHWTDSLRSNIYYGHTQTEVNVVELGAAAQGQNNSLDSLHANIFWSPAARVNIGLEFIHGWRDVAVGANGTEGSGEGSRIQLGMQYVF